MKVKANSYYEYNPVGLDLWDARTIYSLVMLSRLRSYLVVHRLILWAMLMCILRGNLLD